MPNALFHSTSVITCCTVIALATPGFGGDSQPFTITQLVIEGEFIPGVGTVTRIDTLAVNNSGQWIVEADTNAPTDIDSVLIRNGKLYLREGDPLDMPKGATIDSFDSINLNNLGISGWNFFLDGTQDIFDDSGIYLNTQLIIQESDISTAKGFTPGTPYIGFFEATINNNDPPQLLLMASVDDPNIPSSVDRALVVVDLNGAGPGFTETVIFKEGDVLPGQVEAIADFQTGPHDFAFNDLGDVMFIADLTGDTTVDGAVYVNGDLLAQEGSPSPVKGRNWLTLGSGVVNLNNAGDHVYRGRLDGDADTRDLIVTNGAKLVQEGDVLPDTNGQPLTGLGIGPVLVNDNGAALWYGEWTDPDLGAIAGLFYDETLIVQEAVLTEEGFLFDSIAGGQDAFAISDDGRYLIFEANLPGALTGAFLIDFGPACAADFDNSGDVGVKDLLFLLGTWGPCPLKGDCLADFDNSGDVGVKDLLFLLGAWGPCP